MKKKKAQHQTGLELTTSRFRGKYYNVLPSSVLLFFAQSVNIKLASPQATKLSLFFIEKYLVLHLLEGPELRVHHRAEKKAQHPAGFEPTTSLLRVVRSKP